MGKQELADEKVEADDAVQGGQIRGGSAHQSLSSESGEAVRAPLLRADAVVDDEQPVRVVLLLDVSEASVVATPVGLLPSRFEVVALADVRACLPGDGPERLHAALDSLCGFASGVDRWLVSRNSRIGGLLAFGGDRERKSVEHRGIHRGVASACESVRRPSGEPFVEVQLET